MHKIFPSWHILWILQLIPHEKAIVTLDPQTKTPSRRITTKRCFLLCLILVTFFSALLHEGVMWLRNQQLNDLFFTSSNRIVLILTCSRSIITLMHICLTVSLFLWKCGGMAKYVRRGQALLNRLAIEPSRERRHRILFIFIFFGPILVGMLRVALFLGILLRTNWRSPASSYEVFRLSQSPTAFVLESLLELLGGFITLSIIVQVTSFARVLRECAMAINTRLVALRDCVEKDESITASVLQREVLKIRILYEALVKLFCLHEEMFSLPILGGIMTTCGIIFSLLSSFFKQDLSYIGMAAYTLMFLINVYVLFITCFFPIQLYEESLRASETLQEIIHIRQMYAPSIKKGEEIPERHDDVDKSFQLLFGFLQRTLTKPLAVSAGSFVYITRSFLITVTAVMAGFLLFIIERVENQRSGLGCNCRNATSLL